MHKELKKYLKENLPKKTFWAKHKFILLEEDIDLDAFEEHEAGETSQTISIEEDVLPFLEKNNIRLGSDVNINEYIKANQKYNSFQTLLFTMIEERNLTDAEVYNKVHLDRRLFSKIRNDVNYHPSKETVLLLGFSLELNEDEITALLESAAYSLPKNNYYDLIIRFCFMKRIYKIKDINELLDEYNCKLFNY